MSVTHREECFESLAPEVKVFLERMGKAPAMIGDDLKAMRELSNRMATKIERRDYSGKIDDIAIPGPRGPIPVRVYTSPSDGRQPILLYFHGGGWALGSLETEEDTCLALTKRTPCIALSVDYSLAPEHPYPAAPEDCYAALLWAAEHGPAFGGDPQRIAVCGESAGANLAAALTLMSRDRKGPGIVFQTLFYPAVDLTDSVTRSAKDFADGFFINSRDTEDSKARYVPVKEERSLPYVSPLLAPDLSALPPAFVITAGCDPLRDEGEAYAKRLVEAGVRATHIRFEDMIHAFLILFKQSGSRQRALDMAASALREAFGVAIA